MLVKGGQIIADPFANVADGEALPDGAIIVSLKRFVAETDALLARGAPLGVQLETAESPDRLGPSLHRLATIVLHVPYFRDGRAFSWARLLRTRLGYKGEIRVSGHVLKDQIAFYARVGADAFDLSQNIPLSEIQGAFSEISNFYQPSVDGRPTIRQLRAARAATISAS
ncbi:MAG TPA: DUF934 domain-containing protein [Micropepsaceae bacterium]|nr:DUF934 domain-containing protein [Micropepsaceae bacterium]